MGRLILPIDLPRSSTQLSRVLVRESERDERPPIMDVKDLLNEPAIFDWSGDLREFVRSAAMATGCDAWWLRACGDFKGKVSKENDFRLAG